MDDEFNDWPEDAARIARQAALGSYTGNDLALVALTSALRNLEERQAALEARWRASVVVAVVVSAAQAAFGYLWWLNH